MSGTSSNGMDLIRRLREEKFNVEAEQKLLSHPYIVNAGKLTLAQRQAFCFEQYAIQRSDAMSFAALAGHSDFRPDSLTGSTAPPAVKFNKNTGEKDFFQFLLEGEIYASPMLLEHAKSLGIENEEALADRSKRSSLAQSYASYWARLALDKQRAAGAAACAVNFPAWGRMCQRLYDSFDDDNKTGNDFIKFFATPIENLDEMAAAIIDEENNVNYEDMKYHCRMLQECEMMFWDAVYGTKD